jgi:hypothetical protein
VTQRQFAAARKQAGIRCPAARDLGRRPKSPWAEVLEAVLDEDVDEIHQFANRIRGKGDELPASHETCASAIRLAARRRGASTLRPHEYSEERAKALSGVRGRNRRQREARWPPTSQIQQIDWNKVVSEAGLELPERITRNPAVPYQQAVQIYLEHFGYLPTEALLRRSFVDRGLPLTAPEPNHRGAIARLKDERRMAGLFTPPKPLVRGRNSFPEIPEGCLAAFETKLQEMLAIHGTTPKGYWTLERVERGLDEALKRLPPGQALTQRKLQDLARVEPLIPGLSGIQRVCAKNGTNFKRLRQELSGDDGASDSIAMGDMTAFIDLHSSPWERPKREKRLRRVRP